MGEGWPLICMADEHDLVNISNFGINDTVWPYSKLHRSARSTLLCAPGD